MWYATTSTTYCSPTCIDSEKTPWDMHLQKSLTISACMNFLPVYMLCIVTANMFTSPHLYTNTVEW